MREATATTDKAFEATSTADIAAEEQLRAGIYDLLASVLCAPPDAARLKSLAKLTGDDTEFGEAINTLAKLAGSTSDAAATREFNALFIGIGRGELVPYGSYYMTGFLNEKPLALVRASMRKHGIERVETVFEPEDNIGSLCEMMAGLIMGRFGGGAGLDAQRTFFNSHIGPWAGHFFADLEGAKGSVLYAPVGTIGRLFMEIEREAFRLSGAATG